MSFFGGLGLFEHFPLLKMMVFGSTSPSPRIPAAIWRFSLSIWWRTEHHLAGTYSGVIKQFTILGGKSIVILRNFPLKDAVFRLVSSYNLNLFIRWFVTFYCGEPTVWENMFGTKIQDNDPWYSKVFLFFSQKKRRKKRWHFAVSKSIKIFHVRTVPGTVVAWTTRNDVCPETNIKPLKIGLSKNKVI